MQDNRLDRIIDKLDDHSDRLTAIEKDLGHHIKRTDELQALAEEFKRYKWMVMGGVVVLGPVATRLLEVFTK